MEIDKLRTKFISYFNSLGYKQVSPAPVVSTTDPTVLFTTAGMQQFKDYYTDGSKAPSPKIVTVQPVIRTTDIADVGDSTHLTMFEMLGNFSFGASSSLNLKKEAIKEAWRFINRELAIDKSKVAITVFGGDKEADLPIDQETEEIWRSLGIEKIRYVEGLNENFWGPVGTSGPCGPTTEIYVNGIEVWNLVFNQYLKNNRNKFKPLKQVGLDTGAGLERLTATLQNKNSVWQIEPLKTWVTKIGLNENDSRIIVDHLRSILFIASEGIVPGNKGRDYILRRLIRKTVFLLRSSQLKRELVTTIMSEMNHYYKPFYTLNLSQVIEIYLKEAEHFQRTLARAIAHLELWQKQHPSANTKTVTELAFHMYESYGFPKELVIEHLISQGYEVDVNYFNQLFTEHQAISRGVNIGQFKGGLADHEPQTIKHHTATHLLLAALRHVLGTSIVQRGSNVTTERLRLDFSFDRKLTEQEIRKVESLVNQKIAEDIPVTKEEMSKEEALSSGAQAEFGHKYGDIVTVYSIGEFSKELCGGPHVKSTGQLGRFEILKEEASGRGVRRLKARTI